MKTRILCFGDSNTWGAIPGDGGRYPEDVRWTGVLQKELGDKFAVIEEGYNGRTTVHEDAVEGRLSGIQYFGPCCESHSPLDLIILMLGTNDLKQRFSEDPRTIAMGFKRYFDSLSVASMAGNKPKVLLVSPILINASYKNDPILHALFGEQAAEKSEALSAAYQKAAEANGWEFLDAAEYAQASKKDGVHMEADMHRELGMALLRKVKEILC